MGKYSLENFSPYPVRIARPKPLAVSPENPGRGFAQVIECSWRELEPEKGCYMLDTLQKTAEARNPVLVLNPGQPDWGKPEDGEACFARLVRRAGSALLGGRKLAGVLIPPGTDSLEIREAYLAAFDKAPLLADIREEALIRFLQARGISFGLSVPCGEETWIDRCGAFARLSLQDTWEKAPVFVRVSDAEPGENISREVFRWHASLCDKDLDLGYCLTLRRATYPGKVSCGGAFPVRFWFVNTGSAPCYRDFTLKLRLKKEDCEEILPLSIRKENWKTGDIVHNEIVPLSITRPGTYTVWAGAFFGDGSPLKLCIQNREENGFYELGTVEADLLSRPELFTAWDSFYPDGYYPLEDPKAPG